MDTKSLYENAAGVNIDTVHYDYTYERAIGYDGEFALFDYLIRDNGKYAKSKILTNLEIPTGIGDKTTEIDLLLISEYGVIVFEVKNYKGTIYGSESEKYWTQYFKTTNNHRFNNPILQNRYHISALSKIIPEELYSVILFANDECDIRRVLFESPDFCVKKLHNLHTTLTEFCSKEPRISEERIAKLFDTLKAYSKAKDTEGTAQFVNYNTLDELKCGLENSVAERIAEVKANEAEITRKRTAVWKALGILSLIACIVICLHFNSQKNYAIKQKDYALEQYEEMYSKFSQVSEEDYKLSKSIYTLSNVSLTPHEYYVDAYNLAFSITNLSEELNIYFNGNGVKSKLVVALKDGSVSEIKIEDEYRGYALAAYSSSVFGKTCKFEIPIPYALDEIDFIKLSPVNISKTSGSNMNLGDYEISIYRSN